FENRVGPILKEGTVVGFSVSSTDITERKKAEEELKKFKSISDNANYGIGISDNERKLVYANNYFASIHGYKTDELMGKDLSIFHNDKQIERVMKLKQKLLEEGSYNAEEVGHTRKNGTIFPMLMNGIIINDDKGKPLFMATTAIDITEIKEAEKKLKNSEEKYRSLFDHAPDSIILIDTKTGDIADFNDRMNETLGYTREEFKNLKIPDFDLMENSEQYQLHIEEVIREGTVIFETKYLTKNGEIRDILVNANLLKISGKDYIQSILRDITDRKKIERKLRESEQKYRLITTNSQDIVYTLDMNLNNTYISPSVYNVLGYDVDEAILMNPRDNTQRDDLEKISRIYKEEFKLEQKKGLEKDLNRKKMYVIREKHKDGRILTMEHTISWLRDEDGSAVGILGVARDVTEKKMTEILLKESEEKFRNITDQSLMGICILQDDVVKYANQRMADINGYSLEEIMNWQPKEFNKIISSESLDFASEQAKKKQLGLPGVITQYQLQIIKKSGEKIWIENFSKTINFNGRPADLVTCFDITDKKKAEQKLKESEAKLSTAIESLPFPFFMIDESGRYIMQNTNAKKTWGNLIGKTPKDIAKDGETLSLWLSNNLRVFSGETIANEAEYDINGESRYFYDIVAPVYVDDEIQNIIGVNIDITERKKAEQKLKESEEILRATLESTADGILAVDDGGRVTHTNSKFADMWHISQELIEERDDKKLLDYVLDQLKDPEVFISNVEQLYKSTKEDFDTLYFKDGRIFERFSSPLIREGEINGRVWSFRDITKQQKLDQELKESEEKYRQLIDNVSDVILEMKVDGNITYISPKVYDMLGYKPEEIFKLSGFKLIHPEDLPNIVEMIKKDINLVSEIAQKTLKFRIQHKNGHYVSVSANGTMIKVNENTKFVAVLRDITASQIAEQKLKESEIKYKAAYNKAEFYKDIFTHDINNILSNIKTSIELSAMYLKDPNRMTDVEELYRVIRGQFTKGASLVSNIRKLSQIDESISLVKSVEINDILKKEIDFILNSYQTRDVKIRTHIFEEGVLVNANDLLIDLFNNLLNNSIKYNESHVVEIDVKMSKEKKNNTNYIKLEFLDNGIGIPDKRKETLFEKEYSKDIASKGLGIGLTLVKKIVDSYRGEIWVEDRIKGDYSQGSNFIVLIPEA
ncbi:hypothetical protein LCGC14_0934350, partial [marine sediment metagenome]